MEEKEKEQEVGKEKKKSRRNLIIGIVAVLVACCVVSGIINAARMRSPEGQATATAESLAREERNTARTATVAAEATEKARPTDTPAPTDTPGPTNTPGPTDTPKPTSTPKPTNTPKPTATPEIEGTIKEGTHLVGTDIEPGIFVGGAGEGLFGSCYWARLSNLTGSDDIIANDNAEGLFYVEVLPDDVALQTGCQLIPIDKVPARDEFLTTLSPGTYIIGRDIEPGIFVGSAGEGLLDSCYWARLSDLDGSDNIIANDNAEGLFYVEALPDDVAFNTGCSLVTIDQVPARDEFLTVLPPGVYIIGRDIDAGTFRGTAGDDFLESCYWARMSNVNGSNNILANDNANGQYFVELLPSDFALKVGCEIEKTE